MTLVGRGRITLAHWLTGIGLFFFAVTLIGTAIKSESPDSNARCTDKLPPPDKPDDTGSFKIVGVWPQGRTQLGARICVAVVGLAAKPTAPQGGSGAAPNRGTVDVTLFLNDQRSPLTVKAQEGPDRQVLTYDLTPPIDATTDAAAFWRRLIGGKTNDGKMNLTVGLSKTASSTPEVDAPAGANLELVVYLLPLVFLGGGSMLLLIAAFVIYAANSTILRDSALRVRDSAEMTAAQTDLTQAKSATPPDPAKVTAAEQAVKALNERADEPIGTFSLGRTQMALWLALATAGFIFLWLTLGLYLHVITTAILVLLGINGATGLAAVAIDGSTPPKAQSKGFWADILSDATGPQVHRVQVVIWTGILGTIFVWNILRNFVFVEFDTNLLLLMGISNAMYLGFKAKEK
jgi:hypothetical protein